MANSRPQGATGAATTLDTEFNRGLGLYDATMVVIGSMIGSGIFIVSADMARQVGSPGWLLAAWVLTGVLTVTAALSYGELAAMMPRAGGQYVYLREAYSPLWGFLYGWTPFLVIQTGTIAAVAVAFARFLGVLWPAIAENHYSRSRALQRGLRGVALERAARGGAAHRAAHVHEHARAEDGRPIQNIFTIAKTGALLVLIVLGLCPRLERPGGRRQLVVFWTPRGGSNRAGAAGGTARPGDAPGSREIGSLFSAGLE